MALTSSNYIKVGPYRLRPGRIMYWQNSDDEMTIYYDTGYETKALYIRNSTMAQEALRVLGGL